MGSGSAWLLPSLEQSLEVWSSTEPTNEAPRTAAWTTKRCKRGGGKKEEGDVQADDRKTPNTNGLWRRRRRSDEWSLRLTSAPYWAHKSLSESSRVLLDDATFHFLFYASACL